MRHQVIADEEDAGASPPTASTKSRSPGGVCGGGRKVTPTMEDIDETADGVVVEVEKLFPNGDSYSGEFAGNAPQGHGKCIWIDGCVYDGEWRRGNAAGTGKFSWPSGATYDGEFMDGRMEGYGSFIGANGETYQGSWLADQKHGYGKKSYVNGDFYEGQWKRDLQEGQGRYVWRDGIQYVGEWRNGMISGRGVLILANGDLYDGHWENGVPKRSGVFAWPDCSCYLGSWSRDAKSQPQMNGVSYSASLSSSKQSSVDGVFARSSEAEDIPGIFKREPDSEARKITCESTDTIAASVVCVDGSEFGEGEAAYGQSNCCLATDGVKPWPTISKGHKSYDLVHNLQLGIRYSVGKPSSKQQMKLWPGDFDPREKFWTKFPPEGSNITRPHHSSEFRWKDYCPKVFRHLRKLFAVDPADYVKSICGTDSLRELSSPGKSGSLFFLTQDDRFIIKTVRKCEVKILIRMLLNYYQHVCKYENSLLTKFYGVHCVKPIGGHKVRFIVMGNLLCSEHGIHRRFDLKGSSHGRTIYKSEEVVDQTSTLKDLDLNFVFHLQKPWFQNFMWQIERDCEFLEAEGIMDYSLLVGFYFSEDLSVSKMGSYSTSQQASGTHGSFQGQRPLTELSLAESGRWDTRIICLKEQFYIMKADEVVSRSFHIYPTTDQAGKYECAAILKASDFTEVDRAGCQFTTTATVLDNGSQIMSEYESKGGGLNGFFQSIKSGWKRMWDGLINFFTGKTCRSKCSSFFDFSCHLQYVCVSWILMFGLLLAIFPTVIILLWLLHQKGFFDPLHDWWDDRFGNKTETTKIYSKYGKHSRKPHIHHHKDHYVHHKEKLYRKKQNYNGHRHLKPDGGVHHVHKETHKHKHKHKLNKHEPELRDSSAVRGLQSVAKHHEEMQAGRKRGHTYRKELYSKPYIQSHRH